MTDLPGAPPYRGPNTIESLREQLETERRRLADVKQARYHEAEAAEAKLERSETQQETLRWALNEAEAYLEPTTKGDT